MTSPDTPKRADALRNRETILTTAGRLAAERGDAIGMDEVAKRSGLGLGTLYRHFPTKSALLAAIVARRFEAMAVLAHDALSVDDPGEAFQALVLGYLEAADQDAGFRVAVLGPDQFEWDDLAAQKRAFMTTAETIIAAAVEAGRLRPDFTMSDFIMITRGVMTNMTPTRDWRRHLELSLDGVSLRRD